MALVSEEDAYIFVTGQPTCESVEKLTVHELRIIAHHIEISDLSRFRKSEFLNLVQQQLKLDE